MNPTYTEIEAGIALLPTLRREFAAKDYKAEFLAQHRLAIIIAALEAAATLSARVRELEGALKPFADWAPTKEVTESLAIKLEALQIIDEVHSDNNLGIEAAKTIRSLWQHLEIARVALRPFADAYEAARFGYSKQHSDQSIGQKHFDKMPDNWSMENLQFNMGAFRRAARALSPPNSPPQ